MNQLVFFDLCYVLYLLLSVVSEVPTLAFQDFSHINQNIFVFFQQFFLRMAKVFLFIRKLFNITCLLQCI